MTISAGASPFYRKLFGHVQDLGGLFNAHLHLDRAGTLDDVYLDDAGHRILESSFISLHEKHALISSLHAGPAYEDKDLERRINFYLDLMIDVGTRRADTMVDVTADDVGDTALTKLMEIKAARASQIDLRVGAYSPLGFTDDEPERWELFTRAARNADFIGALPEADDVRDYPGHIGFDEHCRRVLLLTQELDTFVHVHTDQRNEPGEDGTERLIQAVREYGPIPAAGEEPAVWAVHMISPSTYEEDRFRRLVDGLVECNIGVICCPSAAIGMRQLRPIRTPTYNSIPRVLELAEAGVAIRLASDNIADICSPSTTANLMDEVFVLSHAIRFYHAGILAKLAAGKRLDPDERAFVAAHLNENAAEIEKAIAGDHD